MRGAPRNGFKNNPDDTMSASKALLRNGEWRIALVLLRFGGLAANGSRHGVFTFWFFRAPELCKFN